jgi:hypothetical protein
MEGVMTEAVSAAEPPTTGRPMSLDDPRALQILTTEHASLLSARSLSWSESFNRTSIFLAVLSAAVVALALVAQATKFGDGFTAFALVILPVVLFIGLTTLLRLGEINLEDVDWVVGMNRLRHAYHDMVPGLEPYFIAPHHDDPAGVLAAYTSRPVHPLVHGLATLPAMLTVVDAAIAGAIAGVIGGALGVDRLAVAVAGVVAFIIVVVALGAYQGRLFYRRVRLASDDVRFPTPEGARRRP